MSNVKKVGRPRLYESDAARVRANRARRDESESRVEFMVSRQALRRLTAFCDRVGVLRSQSLDLLVAWTLDEAGNLQEHPGTVVKAKRAA